MMKTMLENLSGSVVEITLGAEITKKFDTNAVMSLSSPVIVAITSMKVGKFGGSTLVIWPEMKCGFQTASFSQYWEVTDQMKSSLFAVFFVVVELTADSLATSSVNSCGSISLGVVVVAKDVCCRTSCEVDVVDSRAGRLSNGCGDVLKAASRVKFGWPVKLTADSLATSSVNSCGSISLGVGVVAKDVYCRTSCELDVVESGAGRLSNGCGDVLKATSRVKFGWPGLAFLPK
uniref:Uncharacterized protein n=1 Tax=Tanacetum cinerariifolium TaxID=118510 RepID=A0A6L2N1A7_TANCI|nr:hypothetical protein [Tanacetum cinerariifolium]